MRHHRETTEVRLRSAGSRYFIGAAARRLSIRRGRRVAGPFPVAGAPLATGFLQRAGTMFSISETDSLLSILWDTPVGEWPDEVENAVEDGGDGTVYDCTPVVAELRYEGGPLDGIVVAGHLPRYCVGRSITETIGGVDGAWLYSCEVVEAVGDKAVAILEGVEP